MGKTFSTVTRNTFEGGRFQLTSAFELFSLARILIPNGTALYQWKNLGANDQRVFDYLAFKLNGCLILMHERGFSLYQLEVSQSEVILEVAAKLSGEKSGKSGQVNFPVSRELFTVFYAG